MFIRWQTLYCLVRDLLKMKRIISLIVTICICNLSFAQVDCGPYRVMQIQTQDTDLLVLLKSQNGQESWKQIGPWSKPSTKPYLAILMQAYALKKNINLRYIADNYNCDETDYITVPWMVRMS